MITFGGHIAGLFRNETYPIPPGDYACTTMRSIVQHNMVAAVRSDHPPRCAWTGNGRRAAFDILDIPRCAILFIADIDPGEAATSEAMPPRL